MSDKLVFEQSIDIDASPPAIWTVLTLPEFTRQYMFGCDVISDWQAGGELIWKGCTDGIVYVKGTIVEIEAGKLLKYTTFDPNSPDIYEDKPENYLTVTILIEKNEEFNRLTVQQGDFGGAINGQKRYEDTSAGWSMILPRIKELAEDI